jgi:V/A-type H+-transporting ATPase subunit F
MSRLLVVTRPSLAPGFRLAGVEAFAAEDAEQATSLIAEWLEAGEAALLAMDDGLLEGLEPGFRRRLESANQLPFLAIPGGEPLSPMRARRGHIAEMLRRAIGFHITFKGEAAT